MGDFPCEITPHGRDHHATDPERLGCDRSGVGNRSRRCGAAQRRLMDAACGCNACARWPGPGLLPAAGCRASRRGSMHMLGWPVLLPGPQCATRHLPCRPEPQRLRQVQQVRADLLLPQVLLWPRELRRCPNCGPGSVVGGEEVIEMQDVPQRCRDGADAGGGSRDAADARRGGAPAGRSHTHDARGARPAAAHRAAKPAPSVKAARTTRMRDRVRAGSRSAMRLPQPVKRDRSRQPTSLIQRAMLLQTRDSEPVNALRK